MIRTKRLFWLAFNVVTGLVLLIHLYVLALRFVPVPGTLTMVQRSMAGQTIQRDWTKLSEISPYVVEAVMSGEDSRFCQHNGIDWDAVDQAMTDNAKGGRRRGGSTITQQTAKNVFFWNGGGYVRKAGEAYFALLIDFVWGKSRVMEVYLNVAEWGDGIFGVEAAAQARFGKSAKDLSRRDAALLAAVLPSPNKWRVNPPGPYVSDRAGTLQQRMSVIRNSAYASCVTGTATRISRPESEEEYIMPPNPDPEIPQPRDPQPDAPIEEPRPQTPEEFPQEIPPSESPEIPREIPVEVPPTNPPTEIPNEINTDPSTEPNPGL